MTHVIPLHRDGANVATLLLRECSELCGGVGKVGMFRGSVIQASGDLKAAGVCNWRADAEFARVVQIKRNELRLCTAPERLIGRTRKRGSGTEPARAHRREHRKCSSNAMSGDIEAIRAHVWK